MTPEEKLKFMQQLREQARVQEVTQTLLRLMELRRRSLVHEEYKKMGFDVDTQNVLKNGFSIPTTAKFVDVDDDFYDK